MAGNTINVQGNYIDVHDNEVVNLNIDKASVDIQDNISLQKDKARVLTDNIEFVNLMQKAVEKGFCTQEGWHFKWNEKKEAAYFASVASHHFNLSNKHDHSGDLAISWIPFEALFDENNLRSKFNDILQTKIKVQRKNEIDQLFR